MKILFKVIFGVAAACVVISIFLGLFGAMIGLTFGIFGALIGIITEIIFSPISWILLLIYLFYKYTKRVP